MANEKRQPVDSEQQRLKREEQARRSRRRGRQLLGLAVTILVVVGIVSIVQRGFEVVRAMMETSDVEQEEYTQRVKLLVYLDLLPFDNTAQMDQNTIRESGIWAVLEQQGENVQRNEDGNALVPALEVDRYAVGLLGPGFAFESHGSFTDAVQGLTYEYDAASEVYIVPPTSLQAFYLPRVMEIRNESGGIKRVTVGYVATVGSNNEVIDVIDYDHPVRFMDFVFQRDGNEYYLAALQRNTSYVVQAQSGATAQAESSAMAEASEPPALSLSQPAVLPERASSVPPDSQEEADDDSDSQAEEDDSSGGSSSSQSSTGSG